MAAQQATTALPYNNILRHLGQSPELGHGAQNSSMPCDRPAAALAAWHTPARLLVACARCKRKPVAVGARDAAVCRHASQPLTCGGLSTVRRRSPVSSGLRSRRMPKTRSASAAAAAEVQEAHQSHTRSCCGVDAELGCKLLAGAQRTSSHMRCRPHPCSRALLLALHPHYPLGRLSAPLSLPARTQRTVCCVLLPECATHPVVPSPPPSATIVTTPAPTHSPSSSS